MVHPAQQVVDSVAAKDVVGAALDDLSESDAELLRLWAWEQLGPAEIAEVLDCSPGTARTRMHRARARLREALVARGMSGPGIDDPPGPTDPLLPKTPYLTIDCRGKKARWTSGLRPR